MPKKLSWPPAISGYTEAVISKLRAECLNAHRFIDVEDATRGWRYGEDQRTVMGTVRPGKEHRD